MTLARRTLLQGATAIATARIAPAWAQAQDPFRVLGTGIFPVVLMNKTGDGVADIWAAAKKRKLDVISAPTVNLHERLFREASLSETNIHLGMAVNRYLTGRTAKLFHPLDDLQKASPIEDFADIAPQLRQAVTFNGKLHGIPFFSVVGGLHYNEAILAERGLTRPPRTMEEVVEYAKKLTFQRADGGQVSGLSFDGARPTQLIDFLRAFGGEFVTPDFKIHVNRPGTIKAVTVLAELYKLGALPKGMFTWAVEGAVANMQQGLSAMSMSLFTFTPQYNDAAKSRFPGRIKATSIPMAAETRSAEKTVAPRNEVWCWVIPRNAPDKERTWDFIRYASSKDAILRWAPERPSSARLSTYENEAVRSRVPHAEELARAMRRSVLMTTWDNYARAEDLFKDAVESVFLGRVAAKQAMDDVAGRLVALLPKPEKA
jgi:multiple sugar transport system substrate-binding protein